jgi:hypothetical protein
MLVHFDIQRDPVARANVVSQLRAYLALPPPGSGPTGNEQEPNDRLVTATPLSAGSTVAAAIATESDVDYFRLGLPGASNVTLTISIPAPLSRAGRLSVQLLDVDGTRLASTCTAENATTAALTVNNVPENAYALVTAYASQSSLCQASQFSSFAVGAYTLRLNTTSVGAAGLDVAFEPNERVVDATPLAVGTTLTAALGTFRDEDLYRVSLPSASNVSVTIGLPVELSNSGRLNVNLLDVNGNRLATVCTAERATSATLSRNNVPQAILLQITAVSNSSTSCSGASNSSFAVGVYTVRINATAVAAGPLDAAFEPNDRVVGAPLIAAGSTVAAAIATESDVDYFRLGLPGASNVTLTLSLPVALSAAGRLSVQLLDVDGTRIASACTAENATTATLTVNNVPENAYALVTAYASQSSLCQASQFSSFAVGAYTLRLNTASVGAAGLDAAFEPNERLVDATPLAVGTTLTAAIGSIRDEDLYRISMPTARNVTVTIGLPVELSNSGRLNVNLLDASGNRLASACTAERAMTAALFFDNAPTGFLVQITALSSTATSCGGASNSSFAVGVYTVRVAVR